MSQEYQVREDRLPGREWIETLRRLLLDGLNRDLGARDGPQVSCKIDPEETYPDSMTPDTLNRDQFYPDREYHLMDQGSLTMAQARALAFLFGGAKTGPQLRAALGYQPGESGNFAKVTAGLKEAGYAAVRFGDDRHCTRTYSITEAGRAALAETFDGAIAGAHEREHEPLPAPAPAPPPCPPASARPDYASVAALKAAFARLDAPFARHIARYLPRGEVQDEARQALDELRKAITAITGG